MRGMRWGEMTIARVLHVLGVVLRIEYWWMHAMVLVWALFTLLLFVLEPLFLHRRFIESARHDPHATFSLVMRMHWVLLGLSLLTVAGAVAGSHGYLLFVP